MKIVQMMPSLLYGDAVGNDAVAILNALLGHGYESCIYVDVPVSALDIRLPLEHVRHIDEYRDSRDNVILLHLATGSRINTLVKKFKAKLVVIYHNITPARFWEPYSPQTAAVIREGLDEAIGLAKRAEHAIADSEFNKKDLIAMGYTCDIDVVPILLDIDSYGTRPTEKIVKSLKKGGFTNLLYTGRMAPNKKVEDCITAFYYYKKYINDKSRLILVVSRSTEDVYFRKLVKYAQLLDIEDVVFTGHVPFEDMLAYYKSADVYLSMSEHEGFCVPLVEAMYFSVPIVAYASCAVPETLGGCGILLEKKDPMTVAEAINVAAADRKIRTEMIEAEKKRLEELSPARVEKSLMDIIKRL